MGKNRSKKSKHSNWRSYQTDSKTNKKVFLGLLTLAALILIIVAAKLLTFLVSLNQPFSPQLPNQTTSYSSTSSTLNFAVYADNSYLLSINPVSKKMTLIRVSPEILIPDTSLKVKNVTDGKLLSQFYRSMFGTFVDGYIIFSDKSFKFENFARDLKKGSGIVYLLRSIKTDISLIGLIKFSLASRGIRDDNFNIVDLSTSSATFWQLQKNGARNLVIDQGALDRQLQGSLEDSKLSLEGKSIAVFNSTDHPGLAEKAAREITNMGGRVVSTDSLKAHQERSFVFGKKSYTLTRLSFVYNSHCPKGLFGSPDCAKIASELKHQDPSFELGSSKADVIVVLGEDFYTR